MAATRPVPLPGSPTHFLVAAITLPLLVLLCWTLAVACRATLPPGGPVYSVAETYEHLRREPASWVGRTVLVRGRFGMYCDSWAGWGPHPRCVGWETGLTDPGPSARPHVLPLAAAGPSPLLTALRSLPLLARLAPGPRAPVWGRTVVYRVRLEPVLYGPPSQCLYLAAARGTEL